MNELLGFLVLSGPLVFIIPWILVSLALAFFIGKKLPRNNSRILRVLLFSLLIPALMALPFLDSIVGKVYLNYLCTYKTEIKVYKTVKLSHDNWGENGIPKFYDRKTGNFYLTDMYKSNKHHESYSSLLHIDKAYFGLSEKSSDILLGEFSTYRFWGGFINRNLSFGMNAISCDGITDRSSNLRDKIFIPITNG